MMPNTLSSKNCIDDCRCSIGWLRRSSNALIVMTAMALPRWLGAVRAVTSISNKSPLASYQSLPVCPTSLIVHGCVIGKACPSLVVWVTSRSGVPDRKQLDTPFARVSHPDIPLLCTACQYTHKRRYKSQPQKADPARGRLKINYLFTSPYLDHRGLRVLSF